MSGQAGAPPEDRYIVTFESTHYALRVEKLLQDLLPVELIPTPRQITASCGLSLILPARHLEAVQEVLAAAGLDQAQVQIRPWPPANPDK